MKIVLLGDSQRQTYCGYGKYVEEVLKEEGHEVWQPEDNSRFAKYLLRQICDFNNEMQGADVIHFNAGHWDIGVFYSDKEPFTSIEDYKNDLRRIVQELRLITPHLIFCTTTPVRDGHTTETNELIEKFNEAAKEVMKDLGVTINDIYPVLLPVADKCILGKPDCIHPTEEGKIVQGKQVLKVIHEEMNLIK